MDNYCQDYSSPTLLGSGQIAFIQPISSSVVVDASPASTFSISIPIQYLYHHRSPRHSVLFQKSTHRLSILIPVLVPYGNAKASRNRKNRYCIKAVSNEDSWKAQHPDKVVFFKFTGFVQLVYLLLQSFHEFRRFSQGFMVFCKVSFGFCTK